MWFWKKKTLKQRLLAQVDEFFDTFFGMLTVLSILALLFTILLLGK